jgi:hypothetical protein
MTASLWLPASGETHNLCSRRPRAGYGAEPIGRSNHPTSVRIMKSLTHRPGTGAAAAHRQELHGEPETRSERPARAAAEVFRDLRRRNERRARLAEAKRARQLKRATGTARRSA